MRVRTPLVQANAGEGSGNGLREHAILSIVAGEDHFGDSPFYFCRTAVWNYRLASKCATLEMYSFLFFQQPHGSQYFRRHN